MNKCISVCPSNGTPLYHNSKQVGYATSGVWSPILKRYIALAHVKSEYSQNGTILDFELKIEHFKRVTPAKVVKTPFLIKGSVHVQSK